MNVFDGVPTSCPVPGSPEEIERTGREVFEALKSEGFFDGVRNVVDIGCGVGRYAPFILEFGMNYHGYDVMKECIEFACERFPSGQFTHIDFQNDQYNSKGSCNPLDFILMEDDESVDCVIASSLFSHLGTLEVAVTYLAEVYRVLKLGGKFSLSYFSSPPNEITNSAYRTVFRSKDMDYLLKPFTIISACRGETTSRDDQRAVIFEKRNS